MNGGMDYDEDGYPYTGPTVLEDAWYTHHVVSLDFPRPKLPRVHGHQTTLYDALDEALAPSWLVLEARGDEWYANGKPVGRG